MKILMLAVSLLFLVSCGTLMKTENELISTGGKSPKYCLALGQEEVKEKVEEYFNRCLLNQRQVYMNGADITADFYVSKRDLPDATKYVVKVEQYYLNAVFIYKESSASCKTEMLVISNRKDAPADSAAFKPYRDIAAGEKPSCL